ncbi:helix-turn-helix domain-containing protein [Eubacteriales bacterium OttesenSCG-928-N13]|nr:helix-turn-helix domain-containing protein [Eubacteriales bacterium OttesenSCG-928-N13]
MYRKKVLIPDWNELPQTFEKDIVALYMRYTHRHVCQLARDNKIPARKINGKWLFDRDEFRKYWEAHHNGCYV